MTTLTSSATFSVGESTVEIVQTTLNVLPAPGLVTGDGTGRLIHPTLGTYDYPYVPDEWTNFESDIIVPPIWTSTKTLDGASNTLFEGNIRDVEVEERWNSEISGPIEFLRMLLAFWTNPPDPDEAYVEWYPNYINSYGYQVIIKAVTVGGSDVTLNYVTRQDWVEGVIALRMRIVSRL